MHRQLGGKAQVEISSVVGAPREAVSARVSTPEGVNGELMSIARMAIPRGMTPRDAATVPIGTRGLESAT